MNPMQTSNQEQPPNLEQLNLIMTRQSRISQADRADAIAAQAQHLQHSVDILTAEKEALLKKVADVNTEKVALSKENEVLTLKLSKVLAKKQKQKS